MLLNTPAGGIIRISGLHRTTQKVQVTICDTGPGIPEENRDRIFEDRFGSNGMKLEMATALV